MDDEPLHLSTRQRRGLLLVILIGFLLTLAVALTDTAGASTSNAVCTKWAVSKSCCRTVLGVRLCSCWTWRCASSGWRSAARRVSRWQPAIPWPCWAART